MRRCRSDNRKHHLHLARYQVVERLHRTFVWNSHDIHSGHGFEQFGGKMIGGFALVAWPAEYGNSGIVTFMINHNGDVYEKDLGTGTNRIASRLTSFNPDHTWRKVVDTEKQK